MVSEGCDDDCDDDNCDDCNDDNCDDNDDDSYTKKSFDDSINYY